MGKFIFRRILGLIPTMFLIVTLSFFLIRLAPGGPFSREKKGYTRGNAKPLEKISHGRTLI